MADASSQRRGAVAADEHAPRVDPRVVVVPMLLTVVCTLPVWLTGALAVQMRADLRFGIVALGGAVALHRIGGAAVALPLGRLSDRLGPTRAMRIAAALATVAAFGVAALARDWVTLVVFLAISGASNSLGQTAANLALARAVPPGRQGMAFGVKQAALPSASMLAGLAVPILALTVGWRWAFGLAAAMSLAVGLAVPRGGDERYRTPSGTANRGYGRRPLLVLAVALFLGMAAAASLTTFTVEAATAAGLSEANAGLLLTLGSAAAIVTRLVVGGRADKRGGRHLQGVAVLQLTGAIGFLLLATFQIPWIIVGSLVAFAFGWGFNGLFWFAIVRLNPATPAASTGAVMPGGMLGGVAGPLVFGWLAETYSFPTAWAASASWGLAAGLLMLLGRRMLVADLRVRETAG